MAGSGILHTDPSETCAACAAEGTSASDHAGIMAMAAQLAYDRVSVAMRQAKDLAGTADALAEALQVVNISALDKPSLDALGRLFNAVTYDRRETLAARRRSLWRENAVKVPVDVLARLTRIEIVLGCLWSGASDAALVRRTGTGQHYVVSTNDDETMTWRSDADGTRYPHPRYADCHEDEIVRASGRGMTRTQAITALNDATPAQLEPGYGDHTWDDED